MLFSVKITLSSNVSGTLTLIHTLKALWMLKRKSCWVWLSANRRMLRCDDCIKYHLGKSHEPGITTEEMYEVFAVANIVGGTIVIPHTRRAAEYWEALLENAQ